MSDSLVPFSVEATANNHFAWMRTFLGLQRTHMAAVRTAVALIGFGFTVAEFFTRLGMQAPKGAGHLAIAPRDFGLILISAGVVSLAVFTFQYRRAVAYLRSAQFEAISGVGRKAMTLPVYMVSYTVIFIGLVAFSSVLIRS